MASRKIDDLALPLQKIALDFVHDCKEHGIDALIYCTYRSAEEQNALFAKGRTAPGQIVTQSRGGQSKHNLTLDGKPFALAFDAAPVVDGKIDWSTIGPAGKIWHQMGIIAIENGLRWGGNWKGQLRDFPHFELNL